jgi:Protein of unknown function (DUF2934)
MIKELAAQRSIESATSLTPSLAGLAISPKLRGGTHVGETSMAKPSDKEIRAYKLWEQKGQPEGRDEEFWRLAEQELLNEDNSSPLRRPDTL